MDSWCFLARVVVLFHLASIISPFLFLHPESPIILPDLSLTRRIQDRSPISTSKLEFSSLIKMSFRKKAWCRSIGGKNLKNLYNSDNKNHDKSSSMLHPAPCYPLSGVPQLDSFTTWWAIPTFLVLSVVPLMWIISMHGHPSLTWFNFFFVQVPFPLCFNFRCSILCNVFVQFKVSEHRKRHDLSLPWHWQLLDLSIRVTIRYYVPSPDVYSFDIVRVKNMWGRVKSYAQSVLQKTSDHDNQIRG